MSTFFLHLKMEYPPFDIYYVHETCKTEFVANHETLPEISGTNEWQKYPTFLRYRCCDNCSRKFDSNDSVYCVAVVERFFINDGQ